MKALEELKPCPFCGNALEIRGIVNPYGRCQTVGCFMGDRAIIIDDPRQVAAWNRRAREAISAGEGETVREALFVLKKECDFRDEDVCADPTITAAIRTLIAALSALPSPSASPAADAKLDEVADALYRARADDNKPKLTGGVLLPSPMPVRGEITGERKDPSINVWWFDDAPEELQALSTNGGDEDWVIVSGDSENNEWASEVAQKLEVCSTDAYPHPAKPGVLVYITCHA